MSTKIFGNLFVYTFCLLALLVICTPTPTESRRVIFHAERSKQILTGQILATRSKQEPCEKCHMRDHRGNCRRIISYNADGVKC